MESFYKNRIEFIGLNIFFFVVMIIKDFVCIDEGIYRCWI